MKKVKVKNTKQPWVESVVSAKKKKEEKCETKLCEKNMFIQKLTFLFLIRKRLCGYLNKKRKT